MLDSVTHWLWMRTHSDHGSSHSKTRPPVKCDRLAGGRSGNQNKGHLESANFLETSQPLLQAIVWAQVQTSRVLVPIRAGEWSGAKRRLVVIGFQASLLLHFLSLMHVIFWLFVLESVHQCIMTASVACVSGCSCWRWRISSLTPSLMCCLALTIWFN